jgi:hypothetical protein
MSPLGNFVRSFCAALLLSTLHLSAPATGDQQGKKKTESIWYISGNSNHIEAGHYHNLYTTVSPLKTNLIFMDFLCLPQSLPTRQRGSADFEILFCLVPNPGNSQYWYTVLGSLWPLLSCGQP